MYRDSLQIIGSIPIENNANTIGGTTVLTKGLIDYLDRNKIVYSFIQSNRFQGTLASLKNLLFILWKILSYRKKSKYILFNTSQRGMIYVYPLVYVLCRFLKKKIIFRKFGGNFIELYSSLNAMQRFVLDQTLFKSDLIVFETKYIIDNLPNNIDKSKVFWLPNTRRSSTLKHSKKFSKRFVYFGQIKKTKGIYEILEASKFLSNEYEIHLFGPLGAGIKETIFNFSKLKYNGVVNPSEMTNTLLNYDVLLLPSYHDGEGYPGVIIEAMSLGIPTITTYWQSIPEVVKNNVNGLLIPVKSHVALKNAINEIDEENFKVFSKNAIYEFENFNEDNVYPNFLRKIFSL